MSYCMYHICLLHLDCSKYDVFVLRCIANHNFSCEFISQSYFSSFQYHCFYVSKALLLHCNSIAFAMQYY